MNQLPQYKLRRSEALTLFRLNERNAGSPWKRPAIYSMVKYLAQGENTILIQPTFSSYYCFDVFARFG